MNDSPPALLRGKEWRCPRHLLRSSSFPHLRVCLCQGRFIASLDDIRASWNTGGATLLREARRAGLRFSTGRSSSGGHRRAPTATSRLGLALRRSSASRRGKMCWIASVCFCIPENYWAQSSTVSPNSQAWETRASRKLTLSTSLLSARLSHRRRSWTTSVDIAFPRDCAATSLTRRARSVAEGSSCFNLGLVLPSCI